MRATIPRKIIIKESEACGERKIMGCPEQKLYVGKPNYRRPKVSHQKICDLEAK
jgi:hypothetical protein